MKPLKQFPKVSVSILVYNGGKFIAPLLESLSNQSYPADKTEILVIDNGCTDNTAFIVKEQFPKVKLVPFDRNYGFTGGNNRAVAFSSHDLLVFLNVDTICHRDWLTGLVSTLVNDPTIGACASNTISPGDPGFDRREMQKPVDTLCRSELTLFGYARFMIEPQRGIAYSKLLSGCSFIIRRDTMNLWCYIFEESFWIYAEDTDLSLRIHNLGLRTCVTRDSVVYHLHQSYIKASPAKLKIITRAVRNRLIAFYKNMNTMEFILYFPFLFFGSAFKIFTLPMNLWKKIIFFLPFGALSMISMVGALFQLPKYAGKKKLLWQKGKFRHIRS